MNGFIENKIKDIDRRIEVLIRRKEELMRMLCRDEIKRYRCIKRHRLKKKNAR